MERQDRHCDQLVSVLCPFVRSTYFSEILHAIIVSFVLPIMLIFYLLQGACGETVRRRHVSSDFIINVVMPILRHTIQFYI